MNQYLIYLAGPITGHSYKNCTNWRDEFLKNAPIGLKGVSPMRYKHYLKDQDQIQGNYEGFVLSNQRGIFGRDLWDCRRCDAILVNLLGAEHVSIGTVMEIAWGYAFDKPTILVMEEDQNIHDHPMIREACPFRVTTLQEAYDVLVALFDTDVSH